MINCGTFSKENEMFVKGTPMGYVAARGAYINLGDGKDYLDTVLGLGAYPRGYSPILGKAVATIVQATNGLTGPLPYYLWLEVRDRLANVVGIENTRPMRTGSDGCLAAVTLARAVRPGKVVVCKNNYHGQWLQWKDPARGTMIDSSQFIVVDPSNPFTWPGHIGISCIIYEYPLESPTAEWMKYIESMQSKGVIFIADEVVTALRFPGNRAFPDADLAVAGKGLANGFGLYVLGGRSDLMSEFSFENPVFISSTYAGDVAALVGAYFNLGLDGTENLGDELFGLGTKLWDLIDEEFFDPDAPLRIRGQPSRFIFEGDEELRAGFNRYCLEHGMLVNRPFFTCTEHEGHLEYMAEILNGALQARLRAEPPVKLFSKR